MNILAVGAHPDDVEFLCAGTVARLAGLRHATSILAVTAGENGSKTLGPEAATRLRLREAEEAASVIGAKFYYGGVRDKHVFYNAEVRNRLCELFRAVAPDIVFAPSPKDYILDHEFSSLLVRDVATGAAARNLETGAPNPLPPVTTIPYLYYCEPAYQIDIFGSPVRSTTYVDIGQTLETKARMLGRHESQVDFMRLHFGIDSLEELIRGWARTAGKVAGLSHAEGFRQHLAPPFPRDNILVELLSARQVVDGGDAERR